VARRRRRIALDLRETDGVAAAERLACLADVVIEGFRPGVMERLGLGPDRIMNRNRGIVYGRMTGWGQFGELASTAGHDINYLAISGALHCIRAPHGEPVVPLNLAGDLGGGALYLLAGILAALFDRTRTGRGQVVDAAICDSVAHMLTTFYSLRAQGLWSNATGTNVLDGGAPFYRAYRCADGGYIAIGALEPKFYQELIVGLGLDPATLPAQADAGGWERLSCRIAETVAKRTRDEWWRSSGRAMPVSLQS
jgi:alpha-methylacyl-CoA racemase